MPGLQTADRDRGTIRSAVWLFSSFWGKSKVIHYVEAPTPLASLPRPALFLAGGITHCPDWQRVAVESLTRAPGLEGIDFSVLNPRRSVFDVANKQAAREQVTWEWQALRAADVRLFWFPACNAVETVQPIAMFELGRWSALSGGLVVGADPDYPRHLDICLQLELERPGLKVHTSLAGALLSVINALREWADGPQRKRENDAWARLA